MDGFLEGLIDFNKKNPFKIYALCGEYVKNHKPDSNELSYNVLKELLKEQYETQRHFKALLH